MKKLLISLIVILIIGGGGYFVWKKVYEPYKRKADVKNEPFMWGATLKQSPVRKYYPSIWNQQLDLVKGLGADWIRLGYDYAGGFTRMDEMVDAAQQKDLNVLLGFGSETDTLKLSDPYYDGYSSATQMAEHYKGKIEFYQLMSEAGSTALIGGAFSGMKDSDYDPQKYQQIKEWLRGATEAIRKIDPSAKIMITDQWTHFAFFEKLKQDNIDYDYIGWDWFSDMGLLSEKKLDDGTLVYDHLKQLGKPLVLAEVNQRPSDTGMDEAAQADFISKMADFARANNDTIKGFFVHELNDLAPGQTSTKKPEYYGLVGFEMGKDGGYIIGDPKKGYYAFKEAIARNK